MEIVAETPMEIIRNFLWDHPFLILLIFIIGIPGCAAVATKMMLWVLDKIVYAVQGAPPSPPPKPERSADEKAMIRQVAISFMTRRGTSPDYAIEQAEEMVDQLKKKGLLL